MALRIAGKTPVTPVPEDTASENTPEQPEGDMPEDSMPMGAGMKADPLMVHYKDGARVDSEACQGCIHFLAPNSCHLVAGEIDPEGVCNLFTPAEESPDIPEESESEPAPDEDDDAEY